MVLMETVVMTIDELNMYLTAIRKRERRANGVKRGRPLGLFLSKIQ